MKNTDNKKVFHVDMEWMGQGGMCAICIASDEKEAKDQVHTLYGEKFTTIKSTKKVAE